MCHYEISFDKVIVFILLSSLGFISSDIYITSLPLIAQDFDTMNSLVQYTLTVYFIGLATAQIIYALLSERYGINTLIYVGLFIYILSCIFCFFSNTIEQLIVSRLIQALGACSGMVLGRAIIVTMYGDKQSAKIFTLIYPFVGMSPAIMPILGAEITSFLSWRANFLILGIFGIITFVMYAIYIPKLKKMSHNDFTFIKQISLYFQIATNPVFFFSTGLICLADGAYFSYVLKAPFIFFDYGYTVNTMSIFFLFTAASYFIGNYICRKFLAKNTIRYVLNIGVIIFTFATVLLFLGKIVCHIDGASIYVISLSVLTFSNGFIISLGTSIGLNANKNSKIFSSGILGFLQFAVTSLAMFITNNLSYSYLPDLLFSLGFLMLCCSYCLNKNMRVRCVEY